MRLLSMKCMQYFNGLIQKKRNSNALAMEQAVK